MLSTAQIRSAFIDYFVKRGHLPLPSSPVIPFDDPTLLFTNAGMNQFKKVFTGEEKPRAPRAVTTQKCMRAGGKHNDLENVGFTARHHTFFEMLGNFSFGDYFKAEAIEFAWHLLATEWGLDKSRLYVTVYEEDAEAFDLWCKIAPELKSGGRILRFGKKDNYWSMGDIGPCGPCSEIHFDRGEKYGRVSDGAAVNGATDRFVEIWNLVFMQFNQLPGNADLVSLPKPSVDTGAGLERLACVLQGAESNYEIDLFRALIRAIEDVTHVKYDSGPKGASHRVIADHLRALTFCVADGAEISNEKQGYVLRRILRRAARHGRELGVKGAFIYELVPALVAEMGAVYAELKEKQEHVIRVIRAEEESFGRTLDTGLRLFEQAVAKLGEKGLQTLSGEVVFELYDTHGFPVDLTEVMARERGLSVDMAGFEREMERQRARARSASITMLVQGVYSDEDFKVRAVARATGKSATTFMRDDFFAQGNIQVALEQGDGKTLVVILDQTPFYVESGGQVSDIGELSNARTTVTISAVYARDGYILHIGELTRGAVTDVRSGGALTAQIDIPRRRSIMRNHTATHLLQAALRKTLGEQVRQSGSQVNDEKLRFDFSHFGPLTADETARIERMVNEQILIATPVTTVVMSLEEAKKSGAMALFGEKYGDTVRVVSIGEFSKELCGGTHVSNTAEIGPFMITLESGIASGVRRIEAITGKAAITRMLEQKSALAEISRTLNAPDDALADSIGKLQTRYAELEKEIRRFKAEKITQTAEKIGQSEPIGAVTFRWHSFGATDKEAITGWAEYFGGSATPTIAIGIAQIDDKRVVVTSASPAAIAKGAHAGNMAKALFEKYGVRGGGKDSFAQGAAPAGVDDATLFGDFREIVSHKVE